MKAIFKAVFDILTSSLSLPVGTVEEYFLSAIIGLAAYLVAFALVGKLIKEGLPRGLIASIVHWIIRFGIYIVIWSGAYALIKTCQFIMKYWIAILIGMICLLAVPIIIGVIKTMREKKNAPHQM